MNTQHQNCIFCQIVAGTSAAYKLWEDDKHIAFLSIYPNTPGVTVVITKQHYQSYAFALPDEVLSELVLAAKKVAGLIDRNMPGVGRTAMVLEGFGVNHIHAKLFPMHGTEQLAENWQQVKSDNKTFFHKYEGYVSSHDCERAGDEDLARISAQIRGNP